MSDWKTQAPAATAPRWRIASFVRRHRLAPLVLLSPVIAFLMVTLLLPMASMVQLSFYQHGPAGAIIKTAGIQNYTGFLGEALYRGMLGSSAYIGLLACVLTIATAYIPAAVLGLTRSRFKNLLFMIILVPFWTSFIVRTYAWVVLLGANGVVNSTLKAAGVIDSPLSLLYSRGTVIVGLVHALLPFAIVPIYASIERIDESMLEAAATLGARPHQVFAQIVLPLSLPGMIAAAVLVFIEAMGAYITPQLLGSASDMMISQLVQERFLGSFDWPFGAAAAIIYLLFSGIIFAILVMFRQLAQGRLQ